MAILAGLTLPAASLRDVLPRSILQRCRNIAGQAASLSGTVVEIACAQHRHGASCHILADSQITLLMLPVIGFQIVSASYFQAVGKPRHAMLLSLSRQVLFLIPAVLILPYFFGLNGVWAAMPTADLGSSILTACFVAAELRHLHRGSHGQTKRQADSARNTLKVRQDP